MSATLDEGYFDWLYGLIAARSDKNPRKSHWLLARQLYSTPFLWSIRNDDNREMDGRELRFEYLDIIEERSYDLGWMALETSVLEMLIALSRRMSFQTNEEPIEWFWHLCENLDISKWTDHHFRRGGAADVQLKVDRLVNRTYHRDGVGGLFPLRHPHSDQRRVELWYQMSAYLLEREGTTATHH